MSPSREHPRWAPLGAVLLQLFACTLGSDWQPLRIDETAAEEGDAPTLLPPAMFQQAAPPEVPVSTPAPPDAEGTASCSDSSEPRGCDLDLEPPPAAPAECSSDLDCASQNCSAGSCVAASCSDGILNQGESATDCGGPCPAGCAEGNACRSEGDCKSGLSCAAATQRCAPPSCQDGEKNGTEAGLDCGGTCPGCSAGNSCGSGADCVSAICRDAACASASCDDLVRNQDETDTDCGGVCGSCSAGRACTLDTDCQSGACQDGRCCGGQDADCTRCARRLATTLDCTSNGASVETATACGDFLQCLADNVAHCPRRLAPGCTDAGGVCDIAHFGGSGSSAIALADGILGTAQCSF